MIVVVVVVVVAYLFCANASVDRTKTTRHSSYFLDFIFIYSPTLSLRHPKKLLELLLIHSSVLFDILYIYITIYIKKAFRWFLNGNGGGRALVGL